MKTLAFQMIRSVFVLAVLALCQVVARVTQWVVQKVSHV